LDTTSSWCGWDTKPDDLTRGMSSVFNRSGGYYARTGQARTSIEVSIETTPLPRVPEFTLNVAAWACRSSI
jgi:hypothetical protein